MGTFLEEVTNKQLKNLIDDVVAALVGITGRLPAMGTTVSLVGEGKKFRFAIPVIDSITGPVAAADITAGTYDLIRIRAGVETTIVDDGAFSKAVGLVYIDIDFDAGDTWNDDDGYMLLPNMDSKAKIGATTYFLQIVPWSGMVFNLAGIGSEVVAIEAKLDDPTKGLESLYKELVTGYTSAGLMKEAGAVLERLELLKNATMVNEIFTASASTTATVTCAALKDIAGAYIGNVVVPLEGNMQGQSKQITGYNGTNILTVTPAWAQAPGNVKFAVVGHGFKYITDIIGYEGATALADKITAARAGYFDNVNNANLLTIPSLTAITRELLGFVEGNVYVNAAGTAGTAFPLGTATNPTTTVANGGLIAAANRLTKLHVEGLQTINTDISGYTIEGGAGPFAHTLITLAAGVVNTSTNFHHCIVTGTANGIAFFETQCILFNLTGLDGFVRDCDLAGTIRLASPSLGYIDLNNITTMVGPITIDCTNLEAGQNLRIHNFTGTVTFINLAAAATIKIFSSSGANILTAASCTAGTLKIHGDVANLTDGGGGTTITRYDLVGRAKGLDAIYDTATNIYTRIGAPAGASIAADLVTIGLKTAQINSDSGTGTLNTATANPHTATIVPSALPTKMHIEIDISNLNTNTDDFEVQISVGVGAAERVIAWYGLTSDGADITIENSLGASAVTKLRRIDISEILVYAGEQVIVSLKRNAGVDDTVEFKYVCGM